MLSIMEEQECGANIRKDWQGITIGAGFFYVNLDFISPTIFFIGRNNLRNCPADDLDRCWSPFFLQWMVGAALFFVVLLGLCSLAAIICPPLIPVFVLLMLASIVVSKRGFKYAYGDCR